MQHTFDIFEVLPNGDLIWKTVVYGRENAILALEQMATGQRNEFRLMDLNSLSVIACVEQDTITHQYREPLFVN
jgi:hypothetical protein